MVTGGTGADRHVTWTGLAVREGHEAQDVCILSGEGANPKLD